MKLKAVVGALLVAQMLSPTNLMADDFCSNPLKVVCEDTKEVRTLREAEIDRLKNEIRQEASAIAKKKIQALGNGGGLFGTVSRFFKKMKIENQEIVAVASKKLSGFEKNIVSPDIVATIKTYLKDEVQESGLSDSRKNEFKSRIDKIVVGNFADYMEEIGASNKLLPQLFSSHCGLDGLVDNAFATKVANKDFVLICPGWMISLNKAESKAEVLKQVMQVLTHELAHHIDARDYADEYAPMTKCISENFGRTLNRTSRDASACLESDQLCVDTYAAAKKEIESNCRQQEEKCVQTKGILCGVRAKLCKVTPSAKSYAQKLSCEKKSGESCRLKVAESHMGEISADTWGAQVMGSYIKNENLTFEEGSELIAANMMKLCGSRDQGVHPSGDLRILEIMRKNPKIIEALGCSQEIEPKYCQL